jgi:type IX secretion system PorP/SprF family membrane protein
MKKIFTIWLCMVTVMNASAQDLHFSQWFNSPLTTNPANTGFIPDADYRIGGNYREQWAQTAAVPYKTFSVFGDAQLFRNKIENGWMGIGGVLLSDRAGSGNLVSNKLYTSVAYHQMIGFDQLLSLGFNAGIVNKRIDPSKLVFPDQWRGKFFDVPGTSQEVFDRTSIYYFDLQAGLNYAYFPTEDIYINAGFSIHHINRPKETFFNNSSTFDNRIPMRYIGFLNASLKVNENLIVNPNAYFTMQAKTWQAVAGFNAQYNLKNNGEFQFLAGAYYRIKDAFIPMAGLVWKNFKLSVSYDASTSSLSNFGARAYEFSLISNGFYSEYHGDRRQSLCPSF